MQAERLRAKYLEEALGRMVVATHEYQKSTRKVEETDKDFCNAGPQKLISSCVHSLALPYALVL